MLIVRSLILSACGLAIAGCGGPSKPPIAPDRATTTTTTRPPPASEARLTISDPCPARLHDILGPLLVYLATNYRLPEQLEELRQMPGSQSIGAFICATSNQPYIYNPAGIVGANVAQRAVIYDAAPAHDGYRWAIVIKEATPNAPFIAEVVAWPESRFPKTSSVDR